MIGAYAVTFVKYVAIAGVIIGICIICTSIAIISPETAVGSPDMFHNTSIFISFAVGGLCVFILALVLSSAKVVGLAVKWGLEAVDRTVLKADLTVKSALLSVCRGYVNLEGVIIYNPFDQQWRSPYLLKSEKATLKINMRRLIQTRGNDFEATTLFFKGVHVCYEKPAGALANVEVVVNNIAEWDDGELPPLPAKLILGDVSFEDVTCSLYIIAGLGVEVDMTIDLETITFPKFSAINIPEKEDEMDTAVVEVITLLLETFLSTIKRNPKLIWHLAAAATHAIADVGRAAQKAVAGRLHGGG
jgi:hypothetical protein